MNKKRKVKAGSIALYALAVLLLGYGSYMAFSAYTYVNEYYGYQGTEITANLDEAIPYIITQSYPYLCFSIAFYVMGLLLQTPSPKPDTIPTKRSSLALQPCRSSSEKLASTKF